MTMVRYGQRRGIVLDGETWALTWMLRGKTDPIERPGLTGRLREGEDGPGPVTIIVR